MGARDEQMTASDVKKQWKEARRMGMRKQIKKGEHIHGK